MIGSLRTLPVLLAISLLSICGLAAADPLDLAGSVGAHVATDHVDAQGAIDGKLPVSATGSLDATLPDAQSKVDDAKAIADGDAQVATETSHGVLAGISSNLHAFGGWIHGLFASGHVDAQGTAPDVNGNADLDAGVPQPPQPDLGFLGKAKAGLVALLHVG
jgi:hypothetical protein